MPSSPHSVVQLLLSITALDVVCKASNEPTLIKPLVEQLTDLRKTSLAMLFAMLGIYIQANRIVAGGWTIALILLTRNICLMYDCMDDEAFQARVNAVGPAIFTLVNTIPGFAVTAILCTEMIRSCGCLVVGTLQALLAISPGLLQGICEASLLYHSSSTVSPSHPASGGAEASAA